MMKYVPTIGLEIHAELKTRTKMFCDSANNPDEEKPNMNICPVCMAHPGTLPVINKEAVKHVVRVGGAVGGTIADYTEFDRKNYFYPDIPKGYQISQYKYPLVSGGALSGVQITRVHLEEDTATSKHDRGDYSLIDYNRAGVPLMELVTEPVIHDAETAVRFAKELQLLLRYLGASEANMEKGEMRVEANISVAPEGSYIFGTKVEVKNLNSFRVVAKAIEYEIVRQIKAIERGEKVLQETRGWDEGKQATFSQRMKESSHDYRYFPDPDLPKLKLSEIAEFQDITLPELPWQKRARYARDYGIKAEDIESYVVDNELGKLFEKVANELHGNRELIKIASNYITNNIVALQEELGQQVVRNIEPQTLGGIIEMTVGGAVSSTNAKVIIRDMAKGTSIKDPKKYAEEQGLSQKSDEGELKTIAQKIIMENEKVVAEYKAGKIASLQFLIGQGMKATKGSANPEMLKKVFAELLS